jgi:hypothetical protein
VRVAASGSSESGVEVPTPNTLIVTPLEQSPRLAHQAERQIVDVQEVRVQHHIQPTTTTAHRAIEDGRGSK